ncbi:tubulin-tyrosine ligase family-domain-containing protein [Lineolata rhizophorae]|uniref:Tubulin-tyrosine ligase family-domain-containing protein n=1 Tax=Lineolata rhizophorae TaxID=578093 RepID=A0A6A6NPP6_9PEZI|nr:tubulin-tyrosine ligase family-domain-containing protein [Lineolata rhizophorae]
MSQSTSSSPLLYVHVEYEDPYVQPLILSALSSQLPPWSYQLLDCNNGSSSKPLPLLEILPYERLSFDDALAHPSQTLINSYIIRKALIRKHYLAHTARAWVSKRGPESALKKHVVESVEFEVDYAEFLDEALDAAESWDMREAFTRNERRIGEGLQEELEWWILKPGMSDRGQGIRLFSTEQELQEIFEEMEAGNESGGESEDDEEGYGGGTMTSQLRHFVAQPYIHPPLLIDEPDPSAGRKFHIRAYVLAAGALTVWVYQPMLALFAADTYSKPLWETEGLKAHLTNTCLQTADGNMEREGSVRLFWDLPDKVRLAPSSLKEQRQAIEQKGHDLQASKSWKDSVFEQICVTVSELFEAAARGQAVHFQVLPNAFELFGVDFLVDATGNAWLLEVNSFPDFRQTGDELKGLVGGLWEEVVKTAVIPHFGAIDESLNKNTEGASNMLKQVLSVDLGRRLPRN